MTQQPESGPELEAFLALAAAESEARQIPALTARQGELRQELVTARAERGEADAYLRQARSDHDSLQRWGWRRLTATLTGRLREQREATAARLQLAVSRDSTAAARCERVERELDVLRARIEHATGQQQLIPALREHLAEASLAASDDPRAQQLRELREQLATAEVRRRDVHEAIEALVRAEAALTAMTERLHSAKSWGTYDIFGGGVMASVAKHHRIDEANDAASHVQVALGVLRRELGDLHLGLSTLTFDGLERTLDIWFDNIFSDIATQHRITKQLEQVQALRMELAGLRPRLQSMRMESDTTEASLRGEHDRLVDDVVR